MIAALEAMKAVPSAKMASEATVAELQRRWSERQAKLEKKSA